MKVDELIRHFPRAYHMAESRTWESIRRHGLLSTNALLDLFGVDGHDRTVIGERRRPQSVIISNTHFGDIVIRDQKPMSETALRKCLNSGITPLEWYKMLNRRVFFWLSEDRLNRLLSARAYRKQQHCILTLDTAKLLEERMSAATLCPINSGSTIYAPQPRGLNSFLPIGVYPFQEWTAKRGVKDAVVELTFEYAVYGIESCLISVEERKGSEVIDRII